MASKIDKQSIKAIKEFNRFYMDVAQAFDRKAYYPEFSIAQARIIGEIEKEKKCTANQLIKKLGIDRGYMSRILSTFEKDGLIEKKASENDGRVSYIALTAEGKKACSDIAKKMDDRIAASFANIDRDRLEELKNAMASIQSILGETT